MKHIKEYKWLNRKKCLGCKKVFVGNKFRLEHRFKNNCCLTSLIRFYGIKQTEVFFPKIRLTELHIFMSQIMRNNYLYPMEYIFKK